MSAQTKRKQPTPIETAASTDASTVSPDAIPNKKQRQEQATPQFLDFESEEAILPRLGSKPTQFKSLRSAGTDDLFSSKRKAEVSEEETEPTSIDTQQTVNSKGVKYAPRTIGRPFVLKQSEVAAGDIILGTISKITPHSLKIALPEGVVGTITYREISDTLTALFDAQVERHMADPTKVDLQQLTQMDIFQDLPSLEELFVLGQQITPIVLQIKSKEGKSKISLICSLRPSIVNANYVNLTNIPSHGVPMQGDIESVQEKGFVVNFGLPFKGFVPFDAANGIDPTKYIKGQLVTALLPKDKQMTKNERSVTVSLDSGRITHQTIPFTAEMTFEQVRAGQFYSATISKHLADGGLCVQILGTFDATITHLQLPPMMKASDYPLACNVVVRILYSVQKTKAIAATLRADLVNPKSLYGPNINFSSIAQLGDIKQAKIIQVVGKSLVVQFLNDATGATIDYQAIKAAQMADMKQHNGVLSSKAPAPIYGWLPLVGISDLPITDFPKQFKLGSTVSTRVLGFNYSSGLVQLTAKPSLLHAQALSYDDVEPGQKYRGIVVSTLAISQAVTEKKGDKQHFRPKQITNGVVFQISPKVTAFVPTQQLVNQGGTKPNALLAKKFALGSEHDLCVLVADASSNKVIATTKPAFLARFGQDEVFSDYTQARRIFNKYRSQAKPLILGGYVDRCTDKYVVIRYINNISGVVTKEMLVSQGVIDASQTPEYTIGEFILTRVLAVYDDKLSVSLVVSNEDQQKAAKVDAKPKTGLNIGTIVSQVEVVSSSKDENGVPEFAVKFSVQEKEYKGVLSQSQLTDIPSNQASLFKRFSKVGSIFPHAIVLGSNQQTQVATLTVKPSYFIMYSNQDEISLAALEKAPSYSEFSSGLYSIARGSAGKAFVALPKPKDDFAIGTIQSIDTMGLRVIVSNAFFAFIPRRNIGVDATTPLDELFKLGQTIAFSSAKSDDKTHYRIKLPKLFRGFPAKMALFQRQLALIEKVEKRLFKIPADSAPTLNGIALGQVISNAKVSKFNHDNVQFTSPEATKGGYKIVCQNVEFHAPTITESTIGTTCDVIVVGFDAKSKTVNVTTLEAFRPKSKESSLPESIINEPTKAIVLHGGSSPTVAILAADNLIIALQSKPDLMVNYRSFDLFAQDLVPGTEITVFPYSPTQVSFVSRQFTQTTEQTINFPAGAFFDENIKTDSDLQPSSTIQVQVAGLVRSHDLSPVEIDEYDSIDDLFGSSILTSLGETSLDPTTPTPADRYIALIAVADLVDPVVNKKNTAVNILSHLKDLLNKNAPIKAKIVAQREVSQFVKIPSISKRALPKVLLQLTTRLSDFDSDDFKFRSNLSNYQVDSVHNAVVLHADQEAGIFAQVTPSLHVVIRPSACAVKSTKGKKPTISALPFDDVQSALKVGDLINFKLKSDPIVQNDQTFLHGALIHPKLNPTGTDSETKSEYEVDFEMINSWIQNAQFSTDRQYSIGEVVNNARVIRIQPDRYIIGLPGNVLAEINLAEIKDPTTSSFNPTTHFAPGHIIPRVVVLSMKKATPEAKTTYICSARLSRATLLESLPNSAPLRASLLQYAAKHGVDTKDIVESAPEVELSDPKDILTFNQVQKGQLLTGYIAATGPKGVFVQLSGTLTAIVDHNAASRLGSVGVGNPVTLTVKSVFPDGGIILSDSVADSKKDSKKTVFPKLHHEDAQLFETLQRGMILQGTVSRVDDMGVTVLIKGSHHLSGLAYKTNCVDDFNDDWRKLFSIGDKTKGVITQIDKAQNKISLCLKQSVISIAQKEQLTKSKDQDMIDTSAQIKAAELDLDKEQKALQAVAVKEQKVLMNLFNPLAATTTTATKKGKKNKTDDEEEIIDFDADSALTSQLQQMNKASMSDKDEADRQIEMLEHALVGLGESRISFAGSSPMQYELKCASQPNNASFWIAFMAFYLESNQIVKAREVVQRALKLMSVSALEPRWSMFSSLLSLELLYGTPTSLETATAQAIKEFDKIRVYNEVGRIAITSSKYRLAIDYYNKSLRSSGLAQDKASNLNKPRQLLESVQNLYISLISLHFAQQNRTECNNILKQAITQLPSQYSSFIMIKSILLEFQSDHGSVPQGRTLFQTFLKENPKRLDVWTTWIQHEIKLSKKQYQSLHINANSAGQAAKNEFKQQKTRIRELFDIFTTKAVNQYNVTWNTFKAAQMKSIYALAIEFENSPMCANDSRSNTIKQRATIYVHEASTKKE